MDLFVVWWYSHVAELVKELDGYVMCQLRDDDVESPYDPDEGPLQRSLMHYVCSSHHWRS